MHWLVIGSGVSGLAAAKLLRKKSHSVTVSDVKDISEEQKQELQSHQISWVIGPQNASLLTNVQGIIVSPGIAPETPILVEAKRKKILVTTDIDLALQDFSGSLVAVTGTNGKSTTTVMCAHILNKSGMKTFAGGNLGISPCEILTKGETYGAWVLELSSYQLEWSKAVRARVGIFTSFSHDHQARHKTIKNYFAAKWKLFLDLQEDGLAIMSPEIYAQAKEFGFDIEKKKNLKLVAQHEAFDFDLKVYPIRTQHDRWNATCALHAASFILKKPPESLMPTLKDFRALPYRFQEIGTLNGYPVINDSKSTNVESTLKALENISTPCILLLGGISKEENFTPLLQFKDRIAQVLVFGKSAREIGSYLQDKLPLTYYATLQDVLRDVAKWSKDQKGPILFSPACASFDEFKNFEHRGEFFSDKIKACALLKANNS